MDRGEDGEGTADGVHDGDGVGEAEVPVRSELKETGSTNLER